MAASETETQYFYVVGLDFSKEPIECEGLAINKPYEGWVFIYKPDLGEGSPDVLMVPSHRIVFIHKERKTREK